MFFTMAGICLLAYAPSYGYILLSVVLVGIGSSIFHPEASRVAYMASNGRRSFAQSVFQIGGNIGTALAPLLVAWIVLPNGQHYILWFVALVIVAQIVLSFIAKWYSHTLKSEIGRAHV